MPYIDGKKGIEMRVFFWQGIYVLVRDITPPSAHGSVQEATRPY